MRYASPSCIVAILLGKTEASKQVQILTRGPTSCVSVVQFYGEFHSKELASCVRRRETRACTDVFVVKSSLFVGAVGVATRVSANHEDNRRCGPSVLVKRRLSFEASTVMVLHRTSVFRSRRT